ncbi:radical SAM protein [Bradyrhizobium sp. USDA 4011]
MKATRLMDRRCVRRRAARQRRRCCPLLHGRGLAQSKRRDLDSVCDMVSAVKNLGMETCVTLGMLSPRQATRLAQAGLDFYNHNVDTLPEFYGKIISTRTLEDRIDTLGHVRDAGFRVCSGGIVGMGERLEDRLGMLVNLETHPESVPISLWNQVEGVPVNNTAERSDRARAPCGYCPYHDAEERAATFRRTPVHGR